MAKSLLKIQARKLREKGVSVRDISKELHVSKGSASIWTRDIILSIDQLEKLRKNMLKGGELGRVKGALVQKNRRLATIDRCNKEGINTIAVLSKREFLMAGLALYWAEGAKTNGKLSFCNSDPNLIKFMIGWLKNNFNIETERLSLHVGINEVHRGRDEVVKKYWSELTGIPLNQFRKTSFKNFSVHKVYKNHNEHYGTLVVLVLKPGELYYKILGLIKALSILPT